MAWNRPADLFLRPGAFRWSRGLIGEFFRYVVVGGIAFAADFASMVIAEEVFLKPFRWGVYAAVVVGFIVGLAVNYALSLRFVFTAADYREKGRSFAAFVIFGLIGLVGLGLTELGMWFGIAVLSINYMAVKVFVTGAVLLWNYLARRVIVFGGWSKV